MKHPNTPPFTPPRTPLSGAGGLPALLKLVKIDVAAKCLDVSVRQFRRLVANRRNGIRKVRVGLRAVRFRTDDIENYIRRNTQN